MKFIVLADDQRWEALRATAPEAEWIRVKAGDSFMEDQGADAFFNLLDNSYEMDYSNTRVPVFINAMVFSLSELKMPGNVIRVNGWQGFIEKPLWELAGKITREARAILQYLQRQYITVPDEPGLVTGRMLAMIINEAFYAKGDEVSSEADIDTAMKLGTNYPVGPFEWSRRIGLNNIDSLLKKLSAKDPRYTAAPALEKELMISR
ncbi:MAG: 3-hydroxyacyl-CoA dehydrogenase family protein [Ferruginibacter sp.]